MIIEYFKKLIRPLTKKEKDLLINNDKLAVSYVGSSQNGFLYIRPSIIDGQLHVSKITGHRLNNKYFTVDMSWLDKVKLKEVNNIKWDIEIEEKHTNHPNLYNIELSPEFKLETEICNYLKNNNIKHKRQYRCSAGIIDILTDDIIYEVKFNLNRNSLFSGIGQLYMYNASLSKPRKKIIITNEINCKDILLNYINTTDIDILIFNNGSFK